MRFRGLVLILAAGCIGDPPALEECETEDCATTGPSTTESTTTAGTTLTTQTETGDPTSMSADTTSTSTSTTEGDTDTSSGSDSGSDSSSGTETGGVTADDCAIFFDPLAYTAGSRTIENERLVLSFDTSHLTATDLRSNAAFTVENLLYTDESGGASVERFMSVGFFPHWYSYEDTSASWTSREDGGVIQQFDIGWSASGNPGTSTYSVFADGRIHRSDSVTMPGDAMSGWLNTYLAFLPDVFTNVRGLPGPVEYDIATNEPAIDTADHYFQDATNAAQLCAWHSGHNAVLGYAAHPTPTPDYAGLRGTQSKFGGEQGHTMAFITDWVFEDVTASGEHVAHTMVFVDMFNDLDPCACAEIQLGAYLDPPALTIDADGSYAQCTAADSSPDGYCEEFGYYLVQAAGGGSLEMTLSGGDLPTTVLAVEGIDVGGTVAVFVNSSEQALDSNYFVQDGNQADFLHFPHGLRDGDEIVITY